MNTRHTLTQAIARVLTSRGYDDYAADEEIFQELIDEIDGLVRMAQRPVVQQVDPRLFGGLAGEIARGGR